MHDDWELLRRFAVDADQRAFSELVARHLDFVYSRARRMLGDAGARDAEDVTQAVFILLARKAGRIPQRGALVGWLYNVTRYCCANVRRMERRRKRHEQEAAMQSPPEDRVREDLQPLLDEGLAALRAREREAILIRYFENKTIAQTAALLKISPEAAAKRLERGVARLRAFFSRRGMVVSGNELTGTLGAEAHAASAPAGLALVVGSVSGLKGGGAAMAIAAGGNTMMNVARFKVAAAIAAGALLAGGSAALLSRPLLASPRPPLAAITDAPAMPVAAPRPATPASAPAQPAPPPLPPGDAAALARDVIQSESWIDSIHSIHVVAQGAFISSPEAIAQEKANEKRQNLPGKPNTGSDPEHNTGLRERTVDTTEFAIDGDRFRSRIDTEDFVSNLSVWDGSHYIHHSKFQFDGTENYSLNNKLSDGTEPLGSFAWPRADFHVNWWQSPGVNRAFALRGQPPPTMAPRVKPEEFSYLRREKFQGIDCYVLLRRGKQLERWTVGVSDHLMHRQEEFEIPGNPAILQVFSAEAEKCGTHLKDADAIDPWLQSLLPADRDAISNQCWAQINATAKADIEHVSLDFVEVKPGKWFPKTQSYGIAVYPQNPDGSPAPDAYEKASFGKRREIHITEVTVDDKLPDSLFTMDIKEGAEVIDYTGSRYLTYSYKKDRTPEELDQLRAAAVANDQKQSAASLAEERARDRLLKGDPPPLPDMIWSNSKPLSWQDLHGKVVLLYFDAVNENEYQNERTLARDFFNQITRDKLQIVYIRVESARTSEKDVKQFIADNGIQYPVCIDAKLPASGADALTSAFHLRYPESAVLIDATGRVSAFGALQTLIPQAKELSKSSGQVDMP